MFHPVCGLLVCWLIDCQLVGWLVDVPVGACVHACRGLRVRMGMHSGLDNPADLNHSNVSQRVIYSGGWVGGCSVLQACAWVAVAQIAAA